MSDYEDYELELQRTQPNYQEPMSMTALSARKKKRTTLSSGTKTRVGCYPEASEWWDKTACMGSFSWMNLLGGSGAVNGDEMNENRRTTSVSASPIKVDVFLVHIYRKMSSRGFYLGIGFVRGNLPGRKEITRQGDVIPMGTTWVEIHFSPGYFEMCEHSIEKEMIRLNCCWIRGMSVYVLDHTKPIFLPSGLGREDEYRMDGEEEDDFDKGEEDANYAQLAMVEEDEFSGTTHHMDFQQQPPPQKDPTSFWMSVYRVDPTIDTVKTLQFIPSIIEDSQLEHERLPLEKYKWDDPNSDVMIQIRQKILYKTNFGRVCFHLNLPPSQSDRHSYGYIQCVLFLVKSKPVRLDPQVPLEFYSHVLQRIQESTGGVAHPDYFPTTKPWLMYIQPNSSPDFSSSSASSDQPCESIGSMLLAYQPPPSSEYILKHPLPSSSSSTSMVHQPISVDDDDDEMHDDNQ